MGEIVTLRCAAVTNTSLIGYVCIGASRESATLTELRSNCVLYIGLKLSEEKNNDVQAIPIPILAMHNVPVANCHPILVIIRCLVEILKLLLSYVG